MVQLLPGAMRYEARRHVSVMTEHGDCVSDVHLLSGRERARSGSVVWRGGKEGVRVEERWPRRQNGYAHETMVHRGYHRVENHQDEAGYENAVVACLVGDVMFVSVSVTLHQDEATRMAAASANVNVTRAECDRIHGLRNHLRDPSQRDALRSSARVGPAQ